MAVLRVVVLGLLIASSWPIALATSVHSAEAESGVRADLNGRWLLVDSVSNSPRAILEISLSDGTWSTQVLDWSYGKGGAGAKAYIATSKDAFHLVLTSGYVDTDFRANLDQQVVGDTLSGALQFQHPQIPTRLTFPAKLQRTKADKLEALKPKEPDQDKPDSQAALLQLVAHAASLWTEPRFRPLHLKLAQKSLKEIRIDEFTDEVLWAHQRLADAAKESGETELAAATNQQVAKLKSLIEETTADPELTHWKQVEVTRDAGEDRVVLLEQFTGASCGACVAADLAFGALAESFRPSELVAIQYHVHIPVPDPLANLDSITRQSYYAVTSAPRAMFNGQSLAESGGSQTMARKKYNQYSRVVQTLLKNKKQAEIHVRAQRDGDKIQVHATAEVHAPPQDTQRLLLALVENQVTYDGGIGVTSHHYVVRSMLGGANGHAIVDGKTSVIASISVEDLRRTLMAYLEEYPSTETARGKFSRSLPQIPLAEMSVVAFVQDDLSKDVLHAVVVPIQSPGAK